MKSAAPIMIQYFSLQLQWNAVIQVISNTFAPSNKFDWVIKFTEHSLQTIFSLNIHFNHTKVVSKKQTVAIFFLSQLHQKHFKQFNIPTVNCWSYVNKFDFNVVNLIWSLLLCDIEEKKKLTWNNECLVRPDRMNVSHFCSKNFN